MTHPRQQSVYSDNARPDVAPFVPDGVGSVLDAGCGRGGFGRSLRARLGPEARIIGIEPVPDQAARARVDHGFDEVLDGYFPDALQGRTERFDLVCFNDVLEHLVDPWTVLRSTHRHLAPEGRILAAIPSIQYAPVVWDLVRGRWEYADTGTLDRTHLRFFTRTSMLDLFTRAGFEVEVCAGANSVSDLWSTDPLVPRRWAKLGLSRLLGDSRYLHFVLLARPDADRSSGR